MNNTSQISIFKNMENQLNEVIHDNFIARQFLFATNDQTVKNLDNFIEELSNKFKNKITITKFKQGFGNSLIYIHKAKGVEKISEEIEDFLIYIEATKKEGVVVVYANSLEEASLLYNFVFDHSDNEEVMKIQMHNFYFEGRLTHDTSILKDVDLEPTESDYYPDFVSTDLLFEQFSKARESILVLSGPAGTGKTKLATHYMHYLLKNPEAIKKSGIKTISGDYDFPYEGDPSIFEEENKLFINIAYVKNEDILAMDKFWVSLRRNDYDIVILDDLDYFLSPREQVLSMDKDNEKNKFISNFLSFTDGIIPTKTKFIISTNRGVDSIDEALRRDGRLFAVLELSLLSYEEALKIWEKNELEKEEFDKYFGDSDEILQAELGSLINTYKKNDGEAPVSFLKEGSTADISERFLKGKSVGFSINPNDKK